jgi:hypothetical protein
MGAEASHTVTIDPPSESDATAACGTLVGAGGCSSGMPSAPASHWRMCTPDVYARMHAGTPARPEALKESLQVEQPVFEFDEGWCVHDVVHRWLAYREQGDADSAASLCAPDVVVTSPLGSVRGLDKVYVQVLRTRAPSVRSGTEFSVCRTGTATWQLSRVYVVRRGQVDFSLRQEFSTLRLSGAAQGNPRYVITAIETTVA